MNVFDFDKTIYPRDSTVDFWLYCIRRHPAILRVLPKQMVAGVRYLLKQIDKNTFKGLFFAFIPLLPSAIECAGTFWESHAEQIAPWYLAMRQHDDLLISASPAFLLAPIAERLKISPPIATEVDLATGKLIGENCYGQEKVRRFRAAYPDVPVEAFYSDSLSDQPMALVAREAFLVRGGVSPWPEIGSEKL